MQTCLRGCYQAGFFELIFGHSWSIGEPGTRVAPGTVPLQNPKGISRKAFWKTLNHGKLVPWTKVGSAKTDPVQFKWGFGEGFSKDKFAFLRLMKILHLGGEKCLQNAHFSQQKGPCLDQVSFSTPEKECDFRLEFAVPPGTVPLRNPKGTSWKACLENPDMQPGAKEQNLEVKLGLGI